MMLFSVVIPTMWRSNMILTMLPVYEICDFVKEVIFIDNNPAGKPDLSLYKKVRLYSKGSNIFVNPAWNLGASLANYKLILANDDILIPDLYGVLDLINKSDFDIVGMGYTKNKKNMSIMDISDRPFPAMSYGSFMFIRNYIPIPDKLKIWGGDDILYLYNKKRGLLINSKISQKKSTTIDSNKKFFRGVIGVNDRSLFKTMKETGELDEYIGMYSKLR